MPEELLAVLVPRMAKILASVDFGPDVVPQAEYFDYAKEVCEAIWADRLTITVRDDVLSANEEGTDVAWGTA